MGSAGEAIAGVACAILFVEAFFRLRLLPRISRLLKSYASAWRIVRSPRISDHWKERVLPRYACAMLGNAAAITGAMATVAAILFAGIFAICRIAELPWEGGEFLLDWPFNLAALAGGFLFATWRNRFRQ